MAMMSHALMEAPNRYKSEIFSSSPTTASLKILKTSKSLNATVVSKGIQLGGTVKSSGLVR
ncbi:hypothetical protein LOK49_Contig173G00005 [Camellia lanceoleosa]|nr:hypothetical protein LOK49_Contig173G00005 [Camellia lanceoleosa]